MKLPQRMIAIVLVVLFAATGYGLYRTGQPYATVRGQVELGGSAQAQSLVDQTLLITAQRLARMTTSAEEQPFAMEALRISDHDMDLAYAAAERELENHPPVLTAEAKEVSARLKIAEDALDADNALVDRLTAESAKATGAKKDALDDQLILAKAHQ